MAFDPGGTLALAAGRSITGLAGRCLHQPGGGSGSDQQTHPKPEDRQTTTGAPPEQRAHLLV